MGRYYSNSIEGKWAFGVQCSTTPEKFGAEEIEPHTIEYVIYRNNLKSVTDKMAELEEKMGYQKQLLDAFFEKNNGYNDAALHDAGIDPIHMESFWDWHFGKQVLGFFEKNPEENECYIDSEI